MNGISRNRTAVKIKPAEKSFTLIETVIALSLVAFLIIEMAGVQGNAIVFNEFSRRVSQASWLARRVMSQVEYNWATRPFKDLKEEIRDQKFEDMADYSYDLEIKDWKFPFTQLLLGGAGGDEEDDSKGGLGGMIKNVVESVFGDEVLKTAHVTVWWPEGASRGSVEITYLLTNQAKIDDLLTTMKPVWDELLRKEKAAGSPPVAGAAGGTGGTGGTGGAGGAGGAGGTGGTGGTNPNPGGGGSGSGGTP